MLGVFSPFTSLSLILVQSIADYFKSIWIITLEEKYTLFTTFEIWEYQELTNMTHFGTTSKQRGKVLTHILFVLSSARQHML